ncbi:MAG TPA: VPLPA-CTERM-specific exosortase XrtD [Pyrinomonadaceae bacterium]|jgi:exosortase D (VPLPA-CTERM-specific)
MSDSVFNPKNLWKPFLAAATLAFLYASVLAKLGRDWWTDENYSHGLLVPFVIGFIVWLEFDELKKVSRKPSLIFGGALILSALLMLLAGTLGAELFMQRVSLVVMLGGAVVYFFGAKVLRLLLAPFVLLLLAIPIPQIIFNKIAFPLQIWASQMAIWGIRIFEVPSVRKGNVIELLPQGATQVVSLEVVEACSGIRSLMTLMTLALVLAYFTRAKKPSAENGWLDCLKDFDFWRTVILMFSAIPIAILTNAARVTATGVLTFYYGKQAAEGFTHDISGWLVYLVALGLLILVNFVLKKFHRRADAAQPPRGHAEREIPGDNQTVGAPARQRVSASLLIAVLLVGGLCINWLERRGEVAVERKNLSEIPSVLGEWRQKGNDIRFSEQTESVLRTSDYVMRDYYLADGAHANLYVGYYASQRSGATYHSPQNCLPGAGWEMKNPELVEIKTPRGKTFTANRYIIQNGDYAEVLIYWYEGRGRAVASEYKDKIYTVFDSVARRRSDGAMIRVMTPSATGTGDAESVRKAVDLSAQIADRLAEFVPE